MQSLNKDELAAYRVKVGHLLAFLPCLFDRISKHVHGYIKHCLSVATTKILRGG